MDAAKNISTAVVRFFGELTDFLPPGKRNADLSVELVGSPAVKDVIEGLGVPHPEVDAIMINGREAAFRSRLVPRDRVEIFPDARDSGTPCQGGLKPPFEPARGFILDVHLGKLARWLRLLGFDTLYSNHYSDHEIVEMAAGQGRFILTCDIRLLMHGSVRWGRWIRERQPRRQLAEVVGRLSLRRHFAPFTRCMCCNGLLAPASRSDVRNRVPPLAAQLYDLFARCTGCGKVYWEGSHMGGMQSLIDLATTE